MPSGDEAPDFVLWLWWARQDLNESATLHDGMSAKRYRSAVKHLKRRTRSHGRVMRTIVHTSIPPARGCTTSRPGFSGCNRRASSFFAFRFRHSLLSVFIPMLLKWEIGIRFGPVTNGLRSSNGVKGP